MDRIVTYNKRVVENSNVELKIKINKLEIACTNDKIPVSEIIVYN